MLYLLYFYCFISICLECYAYSGLIYISIQRLIKYRCLRSMLDSIQRTRYTLSDVGIADLRHFLYKSKNTSQYTSPAYQAPYDTGDERQRLFSLYQYLHHRIHSPARPLKLLFHVGPYEALLGWVSNCGKYTHTPVNM